MNQDSIQKLHVSLLINYHQEMHTKQKNVLHDNSKQYLLQFQ